MTQFKFNVEKRIFPIFRATHCNTPDNIPINYGLWIVELIYVYPLGKEMILGVYKEQKTFRVSYRQWVATKHDLKNEKPVDVWFLYECVLELAEGTEKQYTVIL